MAAQHPHITSALGDGDAPWRDKAVESFGTPKLKQQLERRARTGQPMHSFNLANSDLSDVDLVNRGHSQGYDLSHSDLYRTNLQQAHLFALNLSHCSLMKADLRGANLHCANLEQANLLGAKFEGAKLDNVHWGKSILQEQLALDALQQGHTEQAQDFLQQAEEIYRNLRIELEKSGLFEYAGYFFYREMIMRRKQHALTHPKRWASKIIDLFCGYGERPLRVVVFSIVLIICCALLYFVLGIQQNELTIAYHAQHSWQQNLHALLTSSYFSVVTFTTLGYGDITPVGLARPVAALQAFTGSFTMALFVVVFVKKMTR